MDTTRITQDHLLVQNPRGDTGPVAQRVKEITHRFTDAGVESYRHTIERACGCCGCNRQMLTWCSVCSGEVCPADAARCGSCSAWVGPTCCRRIELPDGQSMTLCAACLRALRRRQILTRLASPVWLSFVAVYWILFAACWVFAATLRCVSTPMLSLLRVFINWEE